MTTLSARLLAWTALVFVTGMLLSACGFRFRGDVQLPFQSVYVMAGNYNSFSAEIKRLLASGNKTRVVERPEDAQVVLEILSETQQKQILSLSSGGKVREFELLYTIRFRLSGADRRDWIAPTDLTLRRDYTFDDRAQIAKESEEANLLRDMKNDALQMFMRRLEKARPPVTS